MSRQRIGILGYGNLGQYLSDKILRPESPFELAFLQNRSPEKINKPIDDTIPIFGKDFMASMELLNRNDIVVEASHPSVVKEYGAQILQSCSLFVTSLTALADEQTRSALVESAINNKTAIYIPAGAGWGFQDIRKMVSVDTLTDVFIRMTFHANALKLNEPLKSTLMAYQASENQDDVVLYEGDLTSLAEQAPNNVNTMCGLALAAGRSRFDDMKVQLVARKSHHAHEVFIRVEGEGGYLVETRRVNPAKSGAVTGNMTFSSFWSSLLSLQEKRESGIVFV